MKIKNTKIDWIIEIVCLLLLGGITLYLILNWSFMPDKIPMHYNIAGEIDRWGKKTEIIFIPVVSWLLYGFITLMEQFPKTWNTGVQVTEENAPRVYRVLKSMVKTTKLFMVIMFFYITICSITAQSMSPWALLIEMVVIFGNLIYWMVKLFKEAKVKTVL